MTTFAKDQILKALAALPPEEMAAVISEAASALAPVKLVELVDAVVKTSTDPLGVASATIVNMSGQIPHTWSGFNAVNQYCPDEETGIYPKMRVGPFQALYGGGVTTAFANNGKGEPHILLVKKKNFDYWSLPEGYMDPKPSYNPVGVWGMKDGVPITEPPAYDADMRASALRKLAVETGLKPEDHGVPGDKITYVQTLYEITDKPASSEKPGVSRQQVAELFSLDMRDKGYLPPVKGADHVADAVWVPLKDIMVVKTNSGLSVTVPEVSVGEKKIGPLTLDGLDGWYVREINASLAALRNDEVARYGIVRGSLLEAMEGEKPSCELDPKALDFHKEVMRKAAEIASVIAPQLGKAK